MNPVWHFLNGVPFIGPLSIQNTTITLTGPALFADGSATAPGISFASQANKGLFSPASNRVGIAAGGGQLVDINAGTSQFVLEASQSFGWGSSGVGTPDVLLSRGAANRLDLASGDSAFITSGGLGVGTAETTAGSVTATRWNTGGTAAAATTAQKIIKKVTGIADAAATDVITVTVPNANHAAGIKVSFLSSNGSTDAFESSRVAEGFVVLARTSGVATVAAVAALDLAQIATVGSGATHTLAYGVSSISGLASATQTFTIQVTINDSGNLGSNQVVVVAEVINSEATGVTIA